VRSAVLDIEGGRIFIESDRKSFPQIEEIFAFKNKSDDICGVTAGDVKTTARVSELKFRKRPFSAKYRLEKGTILPLLEDTVLHENAVTTFIEYGYAVLDNKVYTCLPEERDLFVMVKEADNPKSLLRAIAALKEKGRLESEYDQVIRELITTPISDLETANTNVFPNKLYNYQREGVQWLLYCYLNNIGTILADDMGLGKTAQIIGLIAECNERDLLKNTLIVVPSTLIENWKREFEFFYPSIKPYVHYGTLRTGLASELEKYKVVITPYSIMTNDIEMMVELDLDLLVFDEASLLKNPQSERTQSAKRLQSSSTIAITGTPLENSLKDLWSLTDLVFSGYLGPLEEFSTRYIGRDIHATLAGNLESLEAHVRQIMIRRLKVDYLDELPERIDIPQPIEMNDAEREYYQKVIDTIRNNRNDKGAVFQEIIRLQQYTAHPELLSESKCYELAHLKGVSAKFCRLFELLDQIAERNEKVIIFANHHEMLDILKGAIEREYGKKVFQIDGRLPNEERQPEIDTFSAQEGFSVLVLNPKTAGMGLNITAANHVIHYSRQWNPALEEQATARAYRNGQKKAVNVYYLFYCNTIEDVINERLGLKRQLSERVVVVEDDKTEDIDIMLDYIGE